MAYTIVNVKEGYGGFVAIGNGTVNDQPAIQGMINALSNVNQGVQLYFPPGIYKLDAPLYLCYDSANNAGFNPDAFHQGRAIFIGSGCGDHSNATATNAVGYTGTVFKFSSTTQNGLVISSSTSFPNTGRNIAIQDIAIYGVTTGKLVSITKINTTTTLERVVIYNNPVSGSTPVAGTALYLSTINDMIFRSMFILGNTKGSGIKLEVEENSTTTGGNILFEDVTASSFDIGFDFGNTYTPVSTSYVKRSYVNTTMIGCQGKSSRIGMRLRYGIGSLTAINLWFEGNAGATGRDLEITDAAGFEISDGVKKCGSINFIGGNFASNDAVLGFVNVQIGRPITTEEAWAGSTGPIKFQGTIWNFIKDYGIKRVNNTYNETLVFDSCSFHNNGGYIVLLDDVAQAGKLIFSGQIATDISNGRYVVNSANADISRRAYFYIPGFTKSESSSTIITPSSGKLNITGSTGNVISITGTSTTLSQITTITDAVILYICFSVNTTVNHSSTPESGYSKILLNGAVNFDAKSKDTLTLVYNSILNAWLEISKSVNSV